MTATYDPVGRGSNPNGEGNLSPDDVIDLSDDVIDLSGDIVGMSGACKMTS